MDMRYAKVLKWIRTHEPNSIERWMESISPSQIESKQWLAKNLASTLPAFGRIKRYQNDDGKSNIEIVGGWFGFPMIQYLYQHYPYINRIALYDIDPIACKIAKKYVEAFNYDFEIRIRNIDYFDQMDRRRAHIIINTSQEHMLPIDTLKEHLITPEKTFVALQSNNMFDEPDHLYCVNDVNELADKSGLSEVIFRGSLPLGNYHRFMVMGNY
jgi:hypothetical protein